MAKVEERVVSLKFKAEQFLSGIKSSLDGLRQLDAGLNKNIATDGLSRISQAVKSIDLESLGVSAENVGTKFSIMANAASVAIGNLASSVIEKAASAVKSFTLDPIIDGFKEYELQLNSTQTILANTASKGENLQTVSAALDELNKYADDTIYNFSQMTANIGRFTAAGVGLKDSVAAIKGMSNLAAVMGADSQQAAHAMQQLSQALATGTVRLQDWMSIENASMGGEAFQEALKRTAATYGTNVDALIEKNGSFRESLKEGWLTSQIMIETLTQLTGDLSDEQLRSMGYTDEQIADIQQYAAMAKSAATEYKTFSQVVGGVQEALGSGWASFWRQIIGDLDQAKALWTTVGNAITKPIDIFFGAVSAVTSEFVNLGGRAAILNTIGNLFKMIAIPLGSVVKGFRDAFSGSPARALATFAKLLEKVTSVFVLSDTAAQKLRETFAGLFSILHIATIPFTQLFKFVSWVGDKLLTLAGIASGGATTGFFSLTAAIMKPFSALNKFLSALDPVGKAIDFLNPKLKVASDWISGKFGNAFTAAKTNLLKFKDAIGERISERLDAMSAGAKNFGQSVKNYFGPKLSEAGASLKAFRDAVGESLSAKLADLKEKLHLIATIFSTVFGNRDIGMALSPFGEKVRDIAEALHNAYAKLREFASGVKAAFGDHITAGLEKLKSGIDSLTSKLTEKLKSFKKPEINTSGLQAQATQAAQAVTAPAAQAAEAVSERAKSKWEGLVDWVKTNVLPVFQSIKDKVGPAISAVGKALGSIGNGFKNAFTIDENELGLMGIIHFLVAGGLVVALNKFANGVKTAADAVKEPLEGMGKVFSSFGGVMDAAAQNIKAKSLLTIAAAIAVLAAAFWVLSNVDTGDSTNAMVAMGVVVSLLLKVMKDLDKIEAGSGKMAAVGGALLLVAGGMLIISLAAAKLSSVDPLGLVQATIAMTVLMETLQDILKSMDKLNMSSVKAGPILATAIALYIAAFAVAKLGKIPFMELAKGTIVAKYLTQFMGESVKLSKGPGTVKTGVILATAVALYVAGRAVSRLGELPFGQALQGVVLLSVILNDISVMLHSSQHVSPRTAMPILAMTIMLLSISHVLESLGSLGWGEILKGVITLELVLTELNAAMKLATTGTAGATNLLIVSGALLVMAHVLKVLGGMNIKALGIALIALAAGLAIVIGAGYLAEKAAPGLMTLAIAFAGLGIIITAFGLVLLGLTSLLTVVAAVGAPAFAILAGGIQLLAATLPAIGRGVAMMFIEILKTIVDNKDVIVAAIIAIGQALCEAVIALAPPLGQAIVAVVTELCNTMVVIAPMLFETAITILLDLLRSLRDHAYEFAVLAMEFIYNFINGVAQKIGDVVDAAMNLIIQFISGLADAIDKYEGQLRAAITKLIKAIVRFLGELGKEALKVGGDMVKGLWNGIVAAKDWIVGKVKGFVGGIVDGVKGALGIHSPSKVMAGIGGYMVEGLAQGLDENGNRAVDAANNMAANTVDAFNKAIKDGVDDELGSFNPTIRPVLDMTDVNHSLSNLRSIPVPAQVQGASDAAMSRTQQNAEAVAGMRPSITFNQTNNSPEALSEADIARNTRNLVARLEYM